MAERWISTKAIRAPKTVAGYRSLLDTVVLPRWRDTSLREVCYDDLQVWITGLSVDGSARFEGKGLSASRVRQAVADAFDAAADGLRTVPALKAVASTGNSP
jgi:hypothetical protein